MTTVRFACALGLAVLAGCGAERGRGEPAADPGGANERPPPAEDGPGEGEGEPAPVVPAVGEGEGEGEPAPAPAGLFAVRPADVLLRKAPGEALTQTFRFVQLMDDGAEVDVPGATWAVSDPLPGAIVPATGEFVAGELGGEAVVQATHEDGYAEATVQVRVVTTLITVGVDEADVPAFSADTQGEAAELLYPAPGTMLPQNIDGVAFQWFPGGAAGALHRLRFTRGFRDFDVFTTADSWTQHGGTFWNSIVDEGRIGWVDVSVTPDGGQESESHTIAFSTAEIFGAIYYWSTTDGGIMRLPIGDQTPERFRVPPGAPIECVGCHAVSRDGFKIAMTHTFGIPTLGNLEVIPTAEPDRPLVASGANVKSFYPTFSPDSTKIVGGSNGILTEREADTGAQLSTAPLPDGIKAIYPDWSPTGDRLVASGTDGLFVADFGVSAADLWLWDRTPDNTQWVNPRPLVSRNGADESNYYPAWAPDGRWVAFNRGGGASGDSAVDNPLFIVRADAPGEAAGAEPIAMVNAGRTSSPPFEREAGGSWPKWSPGRGQHMWIAFSSTRPYGHTATGGPQIWVAAVDPAVAAQGHDPSNAAFWLPYQAPGSGNHIPYWARYEKE